MYGNDKDFSEFQTDDGCDPIWEVESIRSHKGKGKKVAMKSCQRRTTGQQSVREEEERGQGVKGERERPERGALCHMYCAYHVS